MMHVPQNHLLDFKTVLSPAFQEIWENSLLGVLILDKEGRVMYVNRILAQTDDLLSEDTIVVGRKMVDLYPIEREKHISVQVLRSGAPVYKKPIVYYTNTNKLVNSLCSAFPLYTDGEVAGVIHLALNMQTSHLLVAQHVHNTFLPGGDLPQSENIKHSFASLIGTDLQFLTVVNSARLASSTDFNILICAESGCGKELFSQSIHNASRRKDKPFIPINCSAIPEHLLEATLFGTSRGAFTGAVEKAGLLEEAKGGTLLLDELNSMPLALQAKLLRAVQEKKIRRVGANKETPVDVRFISTCNTSPTQALEQHYIREDLFHRLAVIVLEVPPLRLRKSDIFVLSEYFLEKAKRETGNSALHISDEVYQIFSKYYWPGNVRELEHTINAGLAMLHNERSLEKHHLSSYFMSNYRRLTPDGRSDGSETPKKDNHVEAEEKRGGTGLPAFEPGTGKISLKETLEGIEIMYINKALLRAGYNISKAGRFLKLTPQALRYKIAKLKIHLPEE